MTDLLPCPFCSEPGEEREERGWFACSNNDCPAWHLQAVAEDWNRRAPVAATAGTAKASTCCPGEQLIPMRGSDTKLCTGCKTEKHWPLEPGQKRTL